MISIQSKQQFYRVTALGSYFMLLTHLMLWMIWLAPSHHFPTALVLIVMVVPLLFPLRGLLDGKAYTHAWTGFLTLLYFIHGVGDYVVNPSERLYSSIEILLSLALFFSCALYARSTGTQQKQMDKKRTTE